MRVRTILLMALAAGACTTRIDAPSLAPRAIERMPIDPPGEATEAPTALDPALGARLAAIVAGAEQGEARFAAEARTAGTAVAAAAGAAAGSDRWTTAQQALSILETTLGPARDVAAAIDGLRADPANAAPGNRAAVAAAAARVEAMIDAQRAALAALAGKLS